MYCALCSTPALLGLDGSRMEPYRQIKIHNFLALIFLVLIMAELGMGREFDLFSHFGENLESWLCEFNFLEAHPGWKLSSHHYLIGQHPPPTHLRHKPSN